MSKVFKIRHIPSGKFWTPNTGYSARRQNLSLTGKIYVRKPSLKHLGNIYGNYNELGRDGNNLKVNLNEWEIVEYTLKEKGVIK